MTIVDPFAQGVETPTEEAQQPEVQSPLEEAASEPVPPVEKPVSKPKPSKTAPVNAAVEGKVTLTFKGGSGFDAPWIVIHAVDLADAYEQVHGDNARILAELMERAQKIGAHFAGLGPATTARPQRQAAPQAAQEAPGGETRYCSHGEMRYKADISKAGKPYRAFFCPSPDRNDQCKAQFLN